MGGKLRYTGCAANVGFTVIASCCLTRAEKNSNLYDGSASVAERYGLFGFGFVVDSTHVLLVQIFYFHCIMLVIC